MKLFVPFHCAQRLPDAALGTEGIEIRSASGLLLASHLRRGPGAGYIVRDPAHRAALEAGILAAFTTDRPCKKKANRPPGTAARAEASKLLCAYEDKEVVVSLDTYQAIVEMVATERSRP